MRQDEAKPLIIDEWRQWRKDKPNRGGTEMLIFYGWLKEERPHLMDFRCSGDPYQRVKGWLQSFESTWGRVE